MRIGCEASDSAPTQVCVDLTKRFHGGRGARDVSVNGRCADSDAGFSFDYDRGSSAQRSPSGQPSRAQRKPTFPVEESGVELCRAASR